MINKYGYIYKITHIPTGRYYIGQHKGDDPENDGYLGSGTVWKRILKKHADKEFKKEILAWASTEEELCNLEWMYIGNLFETEDLCMNMCPGGSKPPESKYHSKESEERRKKAVAEANRRPEKREASRRGGKHPVSEEAKHKISVFRKGLKPSEESRRKMSESAKKRVHPPRTEEWRKKISESVKRNWALRNGKDDK